MAMAANMPIPALRATAVPAVRYTAADSPGFIRRTTWRPPKSTGTAAPATSHAAQGSMATRPSALARWDMSSPSTTANANPAVPWSMNRESAWGGSISGSVRRARR